MNILRDYLILRVQREDNPANRAECQVKFFPLQEKDGPVVISALSPEDALWIAKQRLPNLAHFLAVQPKDDYDFTITRMLANRVLGRAKDKNAGAKSPDLVGGKSESVGIELVY